MNEMEGGLSSLFKMNGEDVKKIDTYLDNLKGELSSVEAENAKLFDEVENLMTGHLEGEGNRLSNLEGLNSSLEFIQSQEDLETKKSDARLECYSMVERQPDFDGAHGGCKFKVMAICHIRGVWILELNSLIEKKRDILKTLENLDYTFRRCEGVLKIEDALTGLEVIEYEGNQIRLSLGTYIPGTDLPEQNHELAIELLGGRLELRNAEFSLLPMLENKNSLEWFVRKAQDRIVLSTLRRLSIEYEDRDEMIVAHMVDAVDDFIKGAFPTLLVKYPLKLPERDDLCLAFALGVGTPWRHRSLIPGIVMLHKCLLLSNGLKSCRLFGSLKMYDVERVDMGSQAEASSSSKRDMGSYISTMKPSDVKALTRKYKIPRDLHPVAVSSEWTMDRLTDEYIGLYEQYFEFAGLRVPFSTFLLAVIRHFHVHISQLVPLGRFFFIDRRAIPDAMCWRHHDSDISDPAPKDGFDEDDVIALTNQPIDIRGIPSGLLFSAGLAIIWEFPKFRPLFKDPEGNVVTMSDDDEQVPSKTDSQQRVEASDPKIVATRIRKAQAAAKRKAEKNRGSEGAGGSEGGSKRRKEKSDHIPYPTPLRTIEAVASDVSRGDHVISPTQTQGDNLLEIPAHDSANTTTRLNEEHNDEHSGVLGNRDGDFDDDVDEEIDLEGPDRHVSETTERVIIGTESIPTATTRPDNGKSIAQEETPMPDPPPQGAGADEAGSSVPPSLFVPTWEIHQRSRVTTPEECRDLMVNLIPPGVREEMHLLDNNVVLDRAWFSLARGAMAQAHALRQFESLYDTHHALQESLKTTRSHLVRTREDFNVVQNFYNTLSERHRKLREEHAQCSEGLAVVRAEKDSLMATNAEQALRIKELEQQLKSADEVHSSAVKDLEGQLAQKDSALVYAERISSDRLSENEELRTQLAFAPKLVRAAEVAGSKDTVS
ncbi:hypothetical protein Tco_1094838 [Tanacetum coccineum]|uniref:Uncharacterized protein n=1 Tax=Tanacetum coccineum TaxID=301880 RepID=A0ABQ5IGP0_9ASTR